jgi:hypothetical protein
MNKSSIYDRGSFWKSHSMKAFGSGLCKWSPQSPGQLKHYRRRLGVAIINARYVCKHVPSSVLRKRAVCYREKWQCSKKFNIRLKRLFGKAFKEGFRFGFVQNNIEVQYRALFPPKEVIVILLSC